MRPGALLTRFAALAVISVALLVHGCGGGRDDADPTSPESANEPPRTLTVTVESGNGSGTVTIPAVGDGEALVCVVNDGTMEPSCMRVYPWKSTVTLTVAAAQGSRFTGWGGACSGTALTCSLVLTQSRNVTVSFSGSGTLSYTLSVVGAGPGNGTVTSQTELTPRIDCVITAGTGTPGATGTCGGTYLENTAITLSAAAQTASGHTFAGWSGACTGTGTCVVTLTDHKVATAQFAAPAGPEATEGRWEAPSPNPVIGLHLSHLSNGKLLMWGHGGEPQTWTPVGGFAQNTNTTCSNPATCELFCSGHTFLADGRLLVAGGHNESLGDGNGLKQASTFDGNGWTPTGLMTYGRWYPTLVTLEDGRVVVIGGSQDPGVNAAIPERYDGGTWTALTGASRTLPLYPRAFLEPKNGWIFYAGENNSLYLDPSSSGSWTSAELGNGGAHAITYRSYGSAVMFDGKVLYAGGGTNCPTPPEQRAEIIDLNAGTPTWSLTGSMKFARRQLNLTLLPDGKVLTTGGTSACGFTSETGAVFAAEIYNPEEPIAAEQWKKMANAAVVRVYHSTTALLPDGRVVSTGSGEGSGVTNQFSYEIFSPPYLFKGDPPTYNLANTNMSYGQAFRVETPDAASIGKVTIIRHNSSTHGFDMGQRLNTLDFEVALDGQSLTVSAPASGRIAPPGPYMLFILNRNGVPSVAQTILLR